MTKKEALTPPSLVYMFEQIMRGSGLFINSNDWRECKYACHVNWLNPLLEIGAIKETDTSPAWPEGADTGGRPQFNHYKYEATPEGLRWWIEQRCQEIVGNKEVRIERLAEEWFGRTVLNGAEGVGTVVALWEWCHVQAAFLGIKAGYFSMTYYDWGSPYNRQFERLHVALTQKGMEYFDSLPRLTLECA